jgi:5-methylcytosine-specific restriction endonuclease McrA
MVKQSYSELLRDPRWQRKRLEIMGLDDFKCRYCGNHELTLNVHHIHYNKGHKPWEYENDELITLCEDCHKIEHLQLTPLEKFFIDNHRSLLSDDKPMIMFLNKVILKHAANG